MSELPVNWSTASLDAFILNIDAGLNVKCEERPPELTERGLVKISAVTWGRFNEMQSKTLPAGLIPEIRNRIQTGDLLISRANTIELVGASVIVGKVQRQLYLSDKVLRLDVYAPSKRWINYALKTPKLRAAIEQASSGNQLSMRNIAQEKLRSLRIPVAPEMEQKRVCDKLDTMLARVDACRDRLARIGPVLNNFRQSVLAAAVGGRLTMDFREGRGQSDDWLSTTIGSITLDLRYGTSKKCDYLVSGVGVLRIPNVADFGQLDTSDLKYSNFDEGELKKLSIRIGDLLVIRSNGSVDLVGKTGVVGPGEEGLLFAGYLMRLRIDASKVLPRYVWIALSEPTQRHRIVSVSKSTSGVNNINANELRALPLQLPTLSEQSEIVRRVDLLFAFADRLETHLQKAQAAANRLTPALLAKAFRGELVPQDPNDEPAAELLRRLAAQRAQAPVKRGRKKAVVVEGGGQGELMGI